VKLDRMMDTAELSRLVAENYITARDHPRLPHKILNYTPRPSSTATGRGRLSCRGA
jgi:hypothetical protein